MEMYKRIMQRPFFCKPYMEGLNPYFKRICYYLLSYSTCSLTNNTSQTCVDVFVFKQYITILFDKKPVRSVFLTCSEHLFFNIFSERTLNGQRRTLYFITPCDPFFKFLEHKNMNPVLIPL